MKTLKTQVLQIGLF